MKEYKKPDVELVLFQTENVTTIGGESNDDNTDLN